MATYGPVLPISFAAGYGEGVDRALVLGGGGVFFVAWQVGYLRELQRRDPRLVRADRLVGTSAGSLVAAVLASGGLRRLGVQLAAVARAPRIVELLAPAGGLAGSQERALELFRGASDAQPQTLRRIGHAALAAATPPAAKMRRSMGLMVATRRWPSPALHITAADTYTGERLVLTRRSGTSPARAAAASSAVPGLFAPQPVIDRFAMDGGVSGTGTHCDLVAGARRVLVLSLSVALPPGHGMTQSATSFADEISALRGSGSDVIVRGPEHADLETLMDPGAAAAALAMGMRQAATDAAHLF